MDMPMTMSMTFSPFGTYKVPGVIWNWWNIETKGQYAASCLVIILAVVLYRGLVKLEAKLVTYALALATQAEARGSDLGFRLVEGPSDSARLSTGHKRLAVPLWCRLSQALFSALLYGYALLLMLVAMAYNAGLFLCLLAGWVIGEALFTTAFDPQAGGLHGKAAACCE